MHARFPANFLAWFLRRHIAERESAAAEAAATVAHEDGYAAGYTAGEEVGYQQGLAKGKWIIDDRRSPTLMRPIDTSIYGPQRFAIIDKVKHLMKAQVDAAAARAVVSPPTASHGR